MLTFKRPVFPPLHKKAHWIRSGVVCATLGRDHADAYTLEFRTARANEFY